MGQVIFGVVAMVVGLTMLLLADALQARRRRALVRRALAENVPVVIKIKGTLDDAAARAIQRALLDLKRKGG